MLRIELAVVPSVIVMTFGISTEARNSITGNIPGLPGHVLGFIKDLIRPLGPTIEDSIPPSFSR